MKSNSSIKKVAIISKFSIAPAGSILKTVVNQLAGSLMNDYKLIIYYSKTGRIPATVINSNHIETKRLPFAAKGWQCFLCSIWSVMHAAFNADAIVFFNLSGCFMLPVIKLFSKSKIIVHINSIHEVRQFNRLRDLLLYKISLFLAIKLADKVVVADKGLQECIGNNYNVASKVIPYGGNHIKRSPLTNKLLKEFPFLYGKFAFAIANVNDIATTLQILETFERFETYPLVLMGNWKNGVTNQLVYEKYQSFNNIYLIDYPEQRTAYDTILSNAAIYIHPHNKGGFSLSAVEAMYLGIPVIAYNVIQNRTITFDKAWYFTNSNQLYDILKNAYFTELDLMGTVLQQEAFDNYSWNTAAAQYAQIIEELTRNRQKSKYIAKPVKYHDQLLLNLKAGHLKYKHFA